MKKILIIDDQEDFLNLLQQRLLSQFPVTVTAAKCGEDATHLFDLGYQFDLIVCDYQMPHGDGKFVFDYNENQDRAVPFILYTSSVRYPNFQGTSFLGVVFKEQFRKLMELVSNTLFEGAEFNKSVG